MIPIQAISALGGSQVLTQEIERSVVLLLSLLVCDTDWSSHELPISVGCVGG